MTRPLGSIRSYEIDARRKALAGARLAIIENISYREAAMRTGSNAWMVNECFLVLRHGTEEEIAALDSGLTSLRSITNAIRGRSSPAARQPLRKFGAGRTSPMTEIEIRRASFRAARLAIKEGLSHADAAAREHVKRRAVSDAFTILNNCSADEITKAESGEASLNALITQVRKTIPLDVRKAKRKVSQIGQDSRKQRDTEIDLWNKLRDAFDNIAGMPQPSDVVTIVKKHRMREEKVNEKLIAAFAWITEFSDAWTR